MALRGSGDGPVRLPQRGWSMTGAMQPKLMFDALLSALWRQAPLSFATLGPRQARHQRGLSALAQSTGHRETFAA
jgi:hypothetical protein